MNAQNNLFFENPSQAGNKLSVFQIRYDVKWVNYGVFITLSSASVVSPQCGKLYFNHKVDTRL